MAWYGQTRAVTLNLRVFLFSSFFHEPQHLGRSTAPGSEGKAEKCGQRTGGSSFRPVSVKPGLAICMSCAPQAAHLPSLSLPLPH